ncbi:Uncharacterised protein [Streptococcus pneumoniae]|nr:Uncharacterised protein [Streptococcus pneumoniae]
MVLMKIPDTYIQFVMLKGLEFPKKILNFYFKIREERSQDLLKILIE